MSCASCVTFERTADWADLRTCCLYAIQTRRRVFSCLGVLLSTTSRAGSNEACFHEWEYGHVKLSRRAGDMSGCMASDLYIFILLVYQAL